MTRAAFLLPLLIAGCGAGVPTDTHPQEGTDALAQVGRWQLQSAADAQGRPIVAALPQGRAVHSLVFADGLLAVEGGCNHIGARYSIDGSGRLVVPEIESTVRACMDRDLLAADGAVSALLHGTSEWSIAESHPEQLSLQHTDGRRSHWIAVRPAQ